MMHQALTELVAATPELAAMPATSTRLLGLLEDPEVEVAELVEVIEKDPGLTANVLKLCNSSYYGLGREVGSVRDALVRLGNRTVLTVAFATSMGRLLQVPVSAYRLPRGQLWRHALACGVLAARLTPADSALDRNRLFTAGVLHDIGKLLLDRPLRERLEQLPPGLTDGELALAERDLLGFDHAEAGAALAVAWNFPEDLAAAIAGHARPAPAGSLTAIVRAANLLAADRGHDAGTGRVDPVELGLALEAAGFPGADGSDAASSAREEALRDLDGLLALLGASA
jgi:HD-like signal output (HDOD) protein